MTDIKKLAFVGLASLGLITFGSVGCSSSSGTGTGGSTGTGGTSSGTGGTSSHTGGSTGTGGASSGTGGAGGAAVACGSGTTMPPAAALITDFSDAVMAAADAGTSAGKITYGATGTVQGGVSTFQNPASTPGTATISGGALTFSATVSVAGTGQDMFPYSGFVVYVNGPACVDASSYQGVSFKISGDVGTCGLVFSFDDAEHGVAGPSDPRFTGASGDYPPQLTIGSMVTSTATTIQVPFTDTSFANGMPAFSAGGFDPKAITGVQWQFSNSNTATSTCTGTITIDDVTFY